MVCQPTEGSMVWISFYRMRRFAAADIIILGLTRMLRAMRCPG